MREHHRVFWAILALFVALPWLFTHNSGFAAEPIKIGLAGPMSGELARMGRSMREAAELAISEWSEKGGLLGRPVELVVGDDQSDPRQAVAVARKMVEENVWGVVGHFTSSASIPASAVYHEAGIPQITPSSTDPRLTQQGFENVFRTCGRDDQQGLVAADFVMKRLKAKRIAIVHDKTPYGRSLAEAFRGAIGRKVRLLAYEAIVQGDRDFTALLKRLMPLKLDVLYFGGVSHEAGLLLRQMREQGMVAKFVSGDGAIGEELIRAVGEKAAMGSYFTFYPDPLLLPSAKETIAKHERRFGPIGPYSLYTFDAVSALLQAIARARPKDGSRGELLRVSRVLHAMTYDGALGKLRWDRNGDVLRPPYVVYMVEKKGHYLGWFVQVTGRLEEKEQESRVKRGRFPLGE